MPEKPSQEIIIAIAGPAVNVVIALALAAVMVALHISMDRIAVTGGLIGTLLFVNVLIVLFNMIPAFPMDGGRVLRAVLAMRFSYVRATRIASFVGQGVAVLFGIAGLMSGNFMLVFIAMFVFLAASQERAVVQTRSSIAGLPVRSAMLTEFRVVHVNEKLQTVVEHLMSGAQHDFPVLDDGRPVGLISHNEVLQGVRQFGPDATVRQVLRREQEFAEASESLESVIQRLRDLNRTAFPVLLQGRVVGMVTLDQVSELLMVQNAMRRHQRPDRP
jgi:predicted transcriptional regulator